MRVQIQEIIKNNYVVDASGMGVKQFQFTPDSLQEIITTDLTTNYEDCITYINTQVKVEEGIYTSSNTSDNTSLDIRLFFKTAPCEDKEELLSILEGYLKNTFITTA